MIKIIQIFKKFQLLIVLISSIAKYFYSQPRTYLYVCTKMRHKARWHQQAPPPLSACRMTARTFSQHRANAGLMSGLHAIRRLTSTHSAHTLTLKFPDLLIGREAVLRDLVFVRYKDLAKFYLVRCNRHDLNQITWK